MYTILIVNFKAFIGRTAALYVCELTEQHKCSLTDAFLLKLPLPSRKCAETFSVIFF